MASDYSREIRDLSREEGILDASAVLKIPAEVRRLKSSPRPHHMPKNIDDERGPQVHHRCAGCCGAWNNTLTFLPPLAMPLLNP